MPIAPEVTQIQSNYKPDPVAPQPYQSTVIDSKVVRPDQLLTNISGSSIVGTYYRQVIGADDDIAGQVHFRDAVLQQYIKIENFEGKVQNDSKFSQDSETKRMSGELSMDTYPTGLFPNVGDMFVTSGLAGTKLLYKVTSSERMSYYNGACYRLDLAPTGQALGYTLEDLEAKVVETRVFVKSYLQYGEQPIINKGDFESLLELANIRKMMLNDYFSKFFSQRFTTMLVPYQETPTYDQYMVDFIRATVEANDHPLAYKVHSYHTGNLQHLHYSSILQCLVNPDVTTRANIFTKAGKVTKRYITGVINLYSLRNTQIDYVVYPLDPVTNVDDAMFVLPQDYSVICGKANREPVPSPIPATRLAIDQAEPPLIVPATLEYSYVFSESFYQGNPSSLLEELVETYLQKQPLDMKVLTALANSSRYWYPIDQYYYMPVIALLIKKITRSL